MKKNLAIIAAVGLALPAAPLAAQSQSVDVEYKDLDLSTERGQRILDSRIDDAAREVCGANAIRTGTRIRDSQEKQCIASAKRQISTQIAARVEDQRLGG